MGPINFIKSILGFPEWQMQEYLGDLLFIEVFQPNSKRFHFKWSKFHFKWSKASERLKDACLMYPGLEDELKLLQCVNPEFKNDKSMGRKFYAMTDIIREDTSKSKIEMGSAMFEEYNVDNLPLSHFPVSIALFMDFHNSRVRYMIRSDKKQKEKNDKLLAEVKAKRKLMAEVIANRAISNVPLELN